MASTPLNSLNAFVAVARRRSFAAAARELGISSSALSQSVRQLETKLGVQLVDEDLMTIDLVTVSDLIDLVERISHPAGT